MGGGNVTAGVVVGENELLVGQLSEDQLWRFIKGHLLLLLLASSWLLLACISICLARCLCVKDIVLLTVEDFVNVGGAWIFLNLALSLSQRERRLPLFRCFRCRFESTLSLAFISCADCVEQELKATKLEDEMASDGVRLQPVADELREVVVGAPAEVHEGVSADGAFLGRRSKASVQLLDDSDERAESNLSRCLVLVRAAQSQQIGLHHICDPLDLGSRRRLTRDVAEAAGRLLLRYSSGVEE